MVDFHRLNHIKHVVETEYDTWSGQETESAAKLPVRWEAAMSAILRMPVAEYVEPAAVSGEIDTETRRTDMYNGNGNGYGQGPQDRVYEQMNRARDQGGARFPYISAGRHKLALVTLENFQHRTDGKSTRAIFKVLESTTMQPGTFCVRIYKLQKQPKFDSQLSDAELLANMAIALKNAPPGFPIGQSLFTLLEERPADQLARGTVVECTGVDNEKKTWTDLYWKPIQQTEQDIVAMRQRLEAEGIPETGSRPTQAPQQYGQQMQQGYGQQPQYAPPTQPAYGQAQPQQYAQQPTPASPVQPPLQTPQGGFLSQLPPQNGGGQGGGGKW